ncbi:MAG: hypothetical protein ACLGHJ_08160 [Gammaproteobacteria bacterium]
MSVFLLLVGLALFLSGAAMYFAHAARNEPRWIASSILFPFVVPLYYRRHWNELYMAAFVQSTGLAMAVAGGLMLAFQADRPAGLVEQRSGLLSASARVSDSGFVDSERAMQLLVRHGPGTPLAGRLHGHAFNPDRVEFINDTLRLIEGPQFRPVREIAISFPPGSIDIDAGAKRAFAPDGENLPEIRVSWLDAQGQPETEVFRGGYRLEFEMVPLVRNRMSGYVQMTLPDRLESYVGGDTMIVTSHLRYVGEEVDRNWDHEDTLRFVAEEYLRTQYPTPDIATVSFAAMTMDSIEGQGEATAAVTLKDGRVGNHVVVMAKREQGWYVRGPETAAATEAAGFKPLYSAIVQVAVAPRVEAARVAAASAPAVKKGVERTLDFGQLATLSGQGAVVEYRSGRREQGVLRGLRKDRLVVESMKAGGVVEYLLSAGELSLLRMNNGDVIRLAGVEAPTTAAPAPATAAAPAPASAAAQPLMVGDQDISKYLNRSVKVVATTGKTTTGVLRGVSKDGLVIETLVGGGKMDFIVPVDQFASIEFAR